MVVYGAVGLVARPIVWSDSAFGFLGWEARGDLPFNYTHVLDPADISKTVVAFMSIWTPGQHVFPELLQAMGLSLGAAIVWVVTIFSLVGLVGWYALYRDFGFSPLTCALSVFALAVSRHVSAPFGIYVGGEVMLFAVAPWFLLLVWRLRAMPWYAPLPLLAGAACMVFAKLNGLLVSAAAIAAVVAAPRGPWFSRERIRCGVVAGLALALIGAAFYVAWHSKGPAMVSVGGQPDWGALGKLVAVAIASTWGGAFSLTDIAAYLVLHPSRPLVGGVETIAYAFVAPALLTFALVFLRLRDRFAEYLSFWGFMALGYGAVMVWLWIHGSAIGLEERYFRIVSLVLVPGFFETVRGFGRTGRRAALVVLIPLAAYGPASYALHAWKNLHYPLGTRGFRHQTASREVLDLVAKLDRLGPDEAPSLVYTSFPEIGLEFRNVRVNATHAEFVKASDLQSQSFDGRVPRLAVLVHSMLVKDGKGDIILRSFRSYDPQKWQAQPLDGATLYTQGPR